MVTLGEIPVVGKKLAQRFREKTEKLNNVEG